MASNALLDKNVVQLMGYKSTCTMRLSVQHVHFTRQVDSFVGPFWKQFLTTTYGRLFLFQALRLASLEVYYIKVTLQTHSQLLYIVIVTIMS